MLVQYIRRNVSCPHCGHKKEKVLKGCVIAQKVTNSYDHETIVFGWSKRNEIETLPFEKAKALQFAQDRILTGSKHITLAQASGLEPMEKGIPYMIQQEIKAMFPRALKDFRLLPLTEMDETEKEFFKKGLPINAIKHLRERGGMGLKAAKDIVYAFIASLPEKPFSPSGFTLAEHIKKLIAQDLMNGAVTEISAFYGITREQAKKVMAYHILHEE
jgi:hypothetical protein